MSFRIQQFKLICLDYSIHEYEAFFVAQHFLRKVAIVRQHQRQDGITWAILVVSSLFADEGLSKGRNQFSTLYAGR